MQVNQQTFTSPPFDRAAGRSDSARRKHCSVTFPPIQAASDEQRVSSAPAGSATKRNAKHQSMFVLPRSQGDNSPRTVSAASAPGPADQAGASGGSVFTTELRSHVIPPIPTERLSVPSKNAKYRHSPASSVLSQNSFCVNASSRATKDAALPLLAAFQQLVTQVEQEKADAKKLLCEGNVGGALGTLKKALNTVQEYAASAPLRKAGASSNGPAAVARPLSFSATPRSTSSVSLSTSAATVAASITHAALWLTETSQQLAVMYTAAACNAGVWGSMTAEPLAVQKAYFQAAMRYLLKSADEVLFPEWKRLSQPNSESNGNGLQGSSRRSSAAAKAAPKRPKRSLSYSLADGTEPQSTRCYWLRCAVRNNAAVCLADRFSRGGQARTIYELLKAVVDARGMWGVVVLYNLAVAFLGVEHYDDAAEAIARCMELSYYYLQVSEETQRDAFSTPSEAAAAMHTFMALQLIRGHHFIATMAAWCDPAGPMEVQHCEMALGCARKYLRPTDTKQHECQRRVDAAYIRATGAPSVDAVPMLPYMTYDLSFSGVLSGRTTVNGATGSTDIAALVDGFFSLSSASFLERASAVPSEVQAYIKAARKGKAARFWASEAQRHNAAPPFLSAAKALAPLPAILVPSSTVNGEGFGNNANGAATQSQKSSTARGNLAPRRQKPSPQRQTAQTSRGRPSPPAALSLTQSSGPNSSSTQFVLTVNRPSKPAPCFVTTLPQSTFRRYRNLRTNIVTQLENEETAPLGAVLEEDEEDSDDNTTLQPETVTGMLSHVTSATQAPSQRMTALLYGASSVSAGLDALSTEKLYFTPRSTKRDVDADMVQSNSGRMDAADGVGDETTTLAIPVRPSELLRQLDTETETCYSRLVADPLADIRRHAATRLQSWWRARKAIDERKRRSAAVAMRCREEAEAFRIQCIFRVWKRRKLLAAEQEERHEARCREEQISDIQAFLRHRQSLELWGRACVAWYRDLVVRQECYRRQCTAAVKLQSWWRMCATQAAVKTQIDAIVCIQGLWRGAIVRKEQRELRVRRRLAEEAYYQSRQPFARRVQRWWRGCKERVVVLRIMAEKQQAIHSYLEKMQSEYDDALNSALRNPDEAVAAMRTVLAVLAGAHERRQLCERYRFALVRKRAVHRYVIKCCGSIKRKYLAQQRKNELYLQRRREEVAVATLRLQKWARRCVFHRQEVLQAQLEADRNAAAAKVQAAWRMCHARQQLKAFIHFMSCDRHRYAATIQRAWRAHRALLETVPSDEQVDCKKENASEGQQQQQLECCKNAAVRIQAWYHVHCTHEVEKNNSEYPLPLRPVYHDAAQSSPSNDDLVEVMQKFPLNAVNAYVTWIQAFGQAFLAKRSLLHLPPHRSPEAVSPPLSSPVLKFQVPQPPTIPHSKGTSQNSGLALSEGETNTDANAADAPASQHGTPMLPGFCHTGASTTMVPPTSDPAHPSPSYSALPQSFSHLTGSADKLLNFFCSLSTDDPYSTGRVHSPSSPMTSQNNDKENSPDESGAEDADEVEEADGDGSSPILQKTHRTRGSIEDDAILPQPPTAASVESPSGPQAVNFPIPRPPVPQRSMCTVHCHHTPEEISAATYIQAVWRGFRTRSQIEYYYEVYSEEVEEDDEKDDALDDSSGDDE